MSSTRAGPRVWDALHHPPWSTILLIPPRLRRPQKKLEQRTARSRHQKGHQIAAQRRLVGGDPERLVNARNDVPTARGHAFERQPAARGVVVAQPPQCVRRHRPGDVVARVGRLAGGELNGWRIAVGRTERFEGLNPARVAP